MSEPKEGASMLTWVVVATLISVIFVAAFLLLSIKASQSTYDRILAAAQNELAAVLAQQKSASPQAEVNKYELPIEYAMEKLAADNSAVAAVGNEDAAQEVQTVSDASLGHSSAELFNNSCADCHGSNGQGNSQAILLDQNPHFTYPYKNGAKVFVSVKPFSNRSNILASLSDFQAHLSTQSPGKIMHGFPQLDEQEVQGLYQYIKTLAH